MARAPNFIGVVLEHGQAKSALVGEGSGGRERLSRFDDLQWGVWLVVKADKLELGWLSGSESYPFDLFDIDCLCSLFILFGLFLAFTAVLLSVIDPSNDDTQI